MKKVNLNDYQKYASKEYDKYHKLVNRLSNIRLITFISMILMFIVAYYHSNFFNYIGIVLLIIFIVLVIVHNKYYKFEDYYCSYLKVVNQYIDRTCDKWYCFKDMGEDLITDKNVYLEDLDVLGKNSLFQYLSIAKTKGGRRCLYKRFTNIYKDNDSILELSNDIDFCIEYQIKLLEFEEKNVDLEDNYQYLDKSVDNRNIDFIIGIILTLITILFLILALFHILSFKYFYGMFIVHFLACYLYQIIYREEFERLTYCIDNSVKLKELHDCILKGNFQNKKLRNMQDKVRLSMIVIKKLNRLEILNNLKDNVIASFIFNGFLSVNIVTMYLYSKIKLDNDFKLGIEVVEELEAMVSLSIMGVVKNHKCIPVSSNDVVIEFEHLYHPLMKESKCVPNCFQTCNGVNIITGSNMGGKSTFLRTIGINLILMNAGGFVNADSFKSNYYKIFTSMRVSDDALRGISTFYGELLRIKDAIDYINEDKPMVVLVDEIFKGTNYNDRIYGSEEVIKKLNQKNVILFITTHDFELCDVKVNNIYNYHFKEYYEKDKIKFDYIIRNGKCNSTNARYLMEQIGIIKKRT